jgi:hypothetical protein
MAFWLSVVIMGGAASGFSTDVPHEPQNRAADLSSFPQ